MDALLQLLPILLLLPVLLLLPIPIPKTTVLGRLNRCVCSALLTKLLGREGVALRRIRCCGSIVVVVAAAAAAGAVVVVVVVVEGSGAACALLATLDCPTSNTALCVMYEDCQHLHQRITRISILIVVVTVIVKVV